MKITVLGTGVFSLSIALQLAKKENNNIVMWTENDETYKSFNKTHKLSKILDVDIPSNISLTNNLEESLKNTNLVFFITSAKYLVSLCDDIKPFFKPSTPLCIATKGIEDETQEILSNVVKNKLNATNIAVVSGPTFATDLANNDPAALAIASSNRKTYKIVSKNLTTDSLKLRKSSDMIGVQICGSVKNIIAIAAGILSGLGYSESTQAFLINESLHDIKNIIYYLGGKKKTILSFAGVGDLLLTCSSKKSRNYSFGYVIGSTKDKKSIQEFLDTHTVEGYYTLSSVHKLLSLKGIEIKLIELIYNIVMNNEDPETLAKFLINKA